MDKGSLPLRESHIYGVFSSRFVLEGMRLRPKVGFITLGKAPWVAEENVEGLRGDALSAIRKQPLDLCVVDGIPYSVDEVMEAAKLLRREDVDAVLVFHADWTYGELYCVLAKELSEYPMIQWAIYGSPKSVIPLPGLFESAGNMMRLGKRFFYVIGDPNKKDTVERIFKLANAAAVAKKLRRSIVGIAGASNLGMTDTAFSEFHIRRLVPGLLHLDTSELLNSFEKADENEARKVAKGLSRKVGKIEVSEEELITAVRGYLAMKAMVKKYRLDALTIREWPEVPIKEFTMSLGCALLSEEGKVAVSESDISSTVTWLILKLLAEKPVWVGEFESVDLEKNSALLLHNCEAPFDLARSHEEITLTNTGFVEWFRGKKGGVNVQLELKPGRVTIAKISGRPIDDKIKAIVTSGEVMRSPKPPSRGTTRAYVKFDTPLKTLIDTWVKEGFEHHMLLAYADVKEEISALCDLLDIEKIVV